MQPIILSHPISLPNEIQIIHELLSDGLELLHIRKPDYSENDFRSLIENIKPGFHKRLVLHQFHSMAEEFGIHRLHFTTQKRERTTDWNQYSEFLLSTSVHSIEEFNDLPNCFEYAFLSPVFLSISKVGYVSEKNLFAEVKKRTNFHTKLIALGGITFENGQLPIENGFDGVAMLGAIWESNNIKS